MMKRLRMRIVTVSLVALMCTQGLLASDYDKHWAESAISKWSKYGVVTGYPNGDFKPNNPITRSELASILDRVFKFQPTSKPSIYIDIIATPNKWYVDSVNKVTELELMYINGMFFEPEALVTREEAAYAITKAFELTKLNEDNKEFDDEIDISVWAKESVEILSSHGFIAGTPSGEFKPQDTITRAEIVTILDNITSCIIDKSENIGAKITGNVVVNTSDTILKDLTIEGNLYITQGVQNTTLENVVVTGTIYANGGELQLGGKYNEVRLSTGKDINFINGSIQKLIVNKVGSKLYVKEGADVVELVQNAPIKIDGQGSIGDVEIGTSEAPQLQSIGIYVNGTSVSTQASSNQVVISIKDLATQFNNSDVLNGVEFISTSNNSSITSANGSIKTNTFYSWKELENGLGIIREAALGAGISPTLAINKIFGSGEITIGSLLENYNECKELANEFGYDLQDSYTFERYLTSDSGEGTEIYITLEIN